MMRDRSRLPYYAVIFTSKLKASSEDYSTMARKMEDLAKEQNGYLGFESARSELGISISYWSDLGAIKEWKANLAHLEAQQKGKLEWYKWYHVRVCKVEREYEFESSD